MGQQSGNAPPTASVPKVNGANLSNANNANASADDSEEDVSSPKRNGKNVSLSLFPSLLLQVSVEQTWQKEEVK